MIRAKSKSKIKNSQICKKDQEEKQKKGSKDLQKKLEDKENCSNLVKMSMTAVHSKKKSKNQLEESSRQVSPLRINSKKINDMKEQDEKFIEKLFCQTQQMLNKSKDKKSNILLERLIQNLVPESSQITKMKEVSQAQLQSTDIMKQLHIKNQEVEGIKQQLQQLKLYISNFIFKVFDLSVLCRKMSKKIMTEPEGIQFNAKTDEVIVYMDSLVRQWKLQQKIKMHCESVSKKNSTITSTLAKKTEQMFKKRCHTQSLKIPIQDYLQSLQVTGKQELQQQRVILIDKKQEEEDQLMKIISRRSSGVKREQQQCYIAIRNYEAKNENELTIKSGEKVSVLQKSSNDRWLGIKDGKIGYFPRSCLF